MSERVTTRKPKAILRAETNLSRARARVEKLALDLHHARQKVRDAEYALGRARAGEVLTSQSLTTEALRERIADYARDHGAECAHGRAVTDVSWRPFRSALAELARRAGARDR